MESQLGNINLLKKIISDKENPYLNYHANRYIELVQFVDNNFSSNKKILDIGNSPFSEILSKIIDSPVDVLGFLPDSILKFGRQYQFNLNDCYNKSSWRSDIGLYDIIIFAEVIEHLYTSPNQVFAYLYSILEKNGKLILQTPNAAVLHKRFQLLAGKNPYMLLPENRRHPGHYREYTKSELIHFAINSGFKIEKVYYGNYFDYTYSYAQDNKGNAKRYLKLINLFYAVVPSSMKPGITMILQKD